jgi:hypothetical protein
MPKNERSSKTVVGNHGTPDQLKPYVALGVDISWREGQKEAVGECPFCGKENKFSVNTKTGLAHCKHAGCEANNGFNPSTFVSAFHEVCLKGTRLNDYETLAAEKNLLRPEILAEWGLCKNYIDGLWLLPGYITEGEHKGAVRQLYRYMKDAKGHRRFIPTAGLGHHLLGYGSFDPNKKTVYICEGVFDGAALKETLRYTKKVASGNKNCYKLTGDSQLCMLADANVVAVPNACTFLPSWATILDGKTVYFLYDNDHPTKNERTGDYTEPAGYAGMRRGVLEVAKSARTDGLYYLRWQRNNDDVGYDPKLPNGFDVRDHLSNGTTTLEARAAKVGSLLAKTAEAPEEWIIKSDNSKEATIPTAPCISWDELIRAWKEAMEWSYGHDVGLSVMMAAAASTPFKGEQLWVRMMSPPSTGKTWFAEAMGTAKRHVVAKSTIRGFASGKTGDGPGGDISLLGELLGKTFILKDGDTLLRSPTKDVILAEARDIYDGSFRTHYRSGSGRCYENIRMVWILCGTSSLHALDTSELGERFLSCTIMKKAEEKFEQSINDMVFLRTLRNSRQSHLNNGTVESQYDEKQYRAYQLTGGYLEWLWEHATELLDKVSENATVEQGRYVSDLAVFVAHMRARPSRSQDDTTDRELSARLVAQMSRLMLFLSVVMGKDSPDQEVLARVRKVAIDTAEGKTLTFCKCLYKAGQEGMDSRSIAKATPHTDAQVRDYMRFLRSIDVIETFQPQNGASLRYRLTARVRRLYRLVIEGKAV